MKGMGRPLFRVLHNVIPIWISVLKLLKNAHKNVLPSARSFKKSRGGHLLAKTIRCGGELKTESFRYHDRQPLRLLSCGRPDQRHSFRATNETAVALHDSEGGSAMEHYSTAPSSITSLSSSLELWANMDEISEDNQADSTRSLANFTAALDEKIRYPSPQSPICCEEIENQGDRNKQSIVEIAQNMTQTASDSCGSKKVRSSTSSVAKNLSACSAQILQCSDAFVTYSQDPYCDFISSISEMILANHLTHPQELEDLFCCYLHLNSRKYHSIITLAFLEAMALVQLRS